MNEHVDLDPVDLTNCDREPIHQIGAIQNFGALIAVTTDGMIAHRSANFAEMLSLSEPPEIGTQLSALFTPEAMSAIGRASGMLNDPESVERLFAVHLVGGKGPFDCAIHNTDGLTVIEFEPSASDEMDRQLRSLQPILRQLERHRRNYASATGPDHIFYWHHLSVCAGSNFRVDGVVNYSWHLNMGALVFTPHASQFFGQPPS